LTFAVDVGFVGFVGWEWPSLSISLEFGDDG
jgi:hypothetical protein